MGRDAVALLMRECEKEDPESNQDPLFIMLVVFTGLFWPGITGLLRSVRISRL